jgi:thioredoxin reductase
MTHSTHYDVAIIGGGPAGLQAALVLARTRKRLIVFDSPDPPRNAASHGVHNFVGLDGLTPAQIREQAWAQINVYNSTEQRIEHIKEIQPHDKHGFLVIGESGFSITARHVILAIGHRDVHPQINGFAECWGQSIIACPYCDGYENRDRVWGMVARSPMELEHMPNFYRHWTTQGLVLLASDVTLTPEHHTRLTAQGITVHHGDITDLHHTKGNLHAVTLHTGETVNVGTLWWRQDEAPQPLTQVVIATFNLDLDERGYIKVNENGLTSAKGLWVVGDVRGFVGAIRAAFTGSQAAHAMTHTWFIEDTHHE